MSRMKHLSMLVVKLVLFVLVFAVTSTLTAMQEYPTDGISLADDFDEGNIEVLISNGATLEWEVVDGQIVFDVTQSGNNYDDVAVLLCFDDIGYDSSFIRSLLGEDVGRHEDYINTMEQGPWLGYFSFSLKGESFFTANRGKYTFSDAMLNDYVESVLSSAANTGTRTEEFSVDAGEQRLSVLLIFGSEQTGALENGRYTLDLKLKLGHPEGEKLDVGYLELWGILFKVALQALRNTGLGVFGITNWLTLYAVWIILGWFMYLWRDMRTVFGAFLAGSAAGSAVIIRHVFVNGVYAGSEEYSESGFAAGILQAMIVWFILTVTIPLRMLWYAVRDIIYLFREDEVLEDFSYLGNLLGSVGIHVIIIGIAGVFGAGMLLGIISLAVGAAMCIGAHFLCKAVEC